MPSIIQSERLDLIPLTPEVLGQVLAGNGVRAGELLGLTAPEDWQIPRGAMELRRRELEANPRLQPWLLKAVSLRAGRLLVGHVGFHTAPGAEYLAEISPDGVEFGFGVLEPWRHQGIATEASAALMRWARETHQVQRFVLCINPENLPSLCVAAKLGFCKISSHIDEHEGPEDIFEKWD